MTYRSIYPRRLNLLPAAWSVLHQGAGNKCPVYSFGNAWNIMRARHLAAYPQVPMPGEACFDAAYYDAKRYNGGPGGDRGATFWQLQSSLQQYGLATIPWSDGGNLYQQPPPEVYASAAANKPVVFETAPYIRSGPNSSTIYEPNDKTLHETIAMLLSMGKPVPITAYLSTNFWNLPTAGRPEDVQYVYDANDKRGEHAMDVIGRDMDLGLYYILNSWGPGFGAGGVFCVTFAEFIRCVSQVWHIAQCPIPPVPEFAVMSNPVPTSVNAAMLVAFFTRTGVKAQLQAAYSATPGGNWQALLDKGVEHQLPARVVEILAELPEDIIEDYVNRGLATYPRELFYV